MKLNSVGLGGLFSLGLWVGTVSVARAGVGTFQSIEQPPMVKLGITLVGLGLIGLEVWWFLAKKK